MFKPGLQSNKAQGVLQRKSIALAQFFTCGSQVTESTGRSPRPCFSDSANWALGFLVPNQKLTWAQGLAWTLYTSSSSTFSFQMYNMLYQSHMVRLILDHVTAIHLSMHHKNPGYVHAYGIPWLIWLSSSASPRFWSHSQQGAPVEDRTCTNEHKITEVPGAAARAEEATWIPNVHPNVLLGTWCHPAATDAFQLCSAYSHRPLTQTHH